MIRHYIRISLTGAAAALLGLGAAGMIYKYALAPQHHEANALMRQIGNLKASMNEIEQNVAESDRLVKAWTADLARLRVK